MKANEFISESLKNGLDPVVEKQLANIMVIPELNQFYEFYRFMIATAISPGTTNDLPILRNRPAAIAYTSADEEKLNHALKTMNKKGIWLTAGEASEPNDTHSTSPVPSRKKNRYGV